MARNEIEYFYSAHSAFAYIGSEKLYEICSRHQCALIHRPIALSPVIEQVGAPPFAGRTQAHVDYFFGREIERWAEFRRVPFVPYRPTHHDNPLELASGLLIAAMDQGLNIDLLVHAVLQAHWRDDIDLADAEALARCAESVGVDPEPLLQKAMAPDIQARFDRNTQDAIARNVFGSPTYVVNGDSFYGQDHLELIDHALRRPFGPPRFVNPPVGPS